MMTNYDLITKGIQEIYKTEEFIPLHEPTLGVEELNNVSDCVTSGWVSSVGKYVDQFEVDLANYVGVKRAVAVVNGTAALHIALKVAGVKSDDEVFMPALTFVATANATSYLGAIPHFIDVSEHTLGIDPFKLEEHIIAIGRMKDGRLVNKNTNRVISAVVPMHTFGHPVELDELLKVCEKYNLELVEDAAESLGSSYKGKQTGGFGTAAALSFNGNKIITTGGGGAILTDSDKIADYAKHLTTTAKVPHQWEYVHDEVGYNYRMPNINAALGCAQLTKLDEFVKVKRNLANQYEALLSNVVGISLFKEPSNTRGNYWLQTLIIDTEIHDRDELLKQLNESGIMARPIWTPMSELRMFEKCPKSDLSITKKLKMQIINIPSTPITGG